MAGESSTRRANRLALESSPYLLQHAHNPVDWYAWGPEAFEEARRRDVPLFVSIGYATCYWCHVMERESFEDARTAGLMNAHFVNVKVDREERPEVDEVYMAAVQILADRGGWPLNVFVEPRALKPFWAGTYYPPRAAHGLPAFGHVLERMAQAWAENRADLEVQANKLATAITAHLAGAGGGAPVGRQHVARAISTLLMIFDPAAGGFGRAPKFPQPVYLELLLGALPVVDDEHAGAVTHALRHTLDQMALGGIHDQVGGGFHRYSVDHLWIVPHFEKMLYDNAQLASVYARAAARFGDPLYRRVVRRTLDYVLREMRLPEGGFASAQDAEVDGREGRNYLWTADEVRAALDADDAELVLDLYALRDGPNFRDPHHPGEPASNVLRLRERPSAAGARLGVSEEVFLARLDRINARLAEIRAQRPQPRLDDKAIAGWNGMMIGALADGAAALEEPRYLDGAHEAARFVLERMRDRDGTLLRTWRAGRAGPPGVLEDTALVIRGLAALERAERTLRPGSTREHALLAACADLLTRAEVLFGAPDGGYFDTPAGRTDLFVRTRARHDGAIPSGAASMVHAITDLYELTGRPELLARASQAMAAVSGGVAESPVSASSGTLALLRLLRHDVPESAASGVAPARDDGASQPPAGAGVDGPGGGVEIWASEEEIVLAQDVPATLDLRLAIPAGAHMTSAEPGSDGLPLVPLRVGVAGGTGVDAYADYPPGQPLSPEHPVLVHTGEVVVPVAVVRSGAWSGTPRLRVTYQLCTSTACLTPVTVELDVALRRG